MKKGKLISIILSLTISITPNVSIAHSGRTDVYGGHRDNNNKSGLGYYHYHCGGNPPHLHSNGICPYSSKKTTSVKSNTNKSSKVQLNKKIQKRLNELGYNCGKVDGLIGPKTKKAIRQFQEDYGLEVDGIAGPITRKAMGL